MSADAIPAEQHPERFDPDVDGGRLIDAEHRVRYWVAASLVDGADVLDAGCGTGYGTAMLLEAGAASVSGVDVSAEAIEATRKRAPQAKLDVADLHALPYEDDQFDVVVCFEVIEHVRDQPGAFDELRRVLRPGGVLMVSSPNPDVYPPGNPHHVHELTPAELTAALRERFASVGLYRQYTCLSSVVVDDAEADTLDQPAALSVRLVAPLTPGAEPYSVALASDGKLPSPAGMATLTAPGELQWFRDRIAYLEQHLAIVEDARDTEIRRLMREVELNAARADEAQRHAAEAGAALLDVESRNAALVDAERRMAEVRDERRRYELDVERVLAEKDAEIARVKSIVTGIEASISWRLTRPLRGVKRRLASG